MLPVAIGAASSLIDALKSLTSSSGVSSDNHAKPWAKAFDNVGTAPAPTDPPPPAVGGVQIAPGTMNALLQAQGQSSAQITPAVSPPDPLKDLFSQLDANGDGQISKAEFENALGAGGTNLAQADDVFSKLDQNSDGSVGLDEMASALKAGHGHRHAMRAFDRNAAGDGTDSDPLAQAQGATSTSVTNSDGSVTTSLTYVDGSTVTMTSAAPAATNAAAASATASYHSIEQMIQREAQAIANSAAGSLSVSV